MPTLEEIEQAFWSKVWRCTHRFPCKRCCWPWLDLDLTANWKWTWQQRGHFSCPGLRTIPAYRFALELRMRTPLLRIKTLHTCHQCHFGPCCNPWHVVPGSTSDNAADIVHARRNPPSIHLPDGRRWSYTAAVAAQKAFEDARKFEHVYAGDIPVLFRPFAHRLHPLLVHKRS